MNDRGVPTVAGVVWLLIGMLLAAGCSVGPDYIRPEAPQPDAFQTTEGAVPLQPEEVRWWRSLNDPQLVTYIEEGIRENQNLKAAEARVREARALRGVAAAGLMPHADAGAGYNHSRMSGTAGLIGQLPPGFINLDQDLFQVGFDAGWEIDIFGGRQRQVQAATAREQATIENYRDVMISVIAEIARNYVELRGAQRRLTIAQKNCDILEKTLSLVQVRLDADIGSELDLAQAQAQCERTRATLPPLNALIHGSAYRLAVLIGQPPAALLEELLSTAPLPNPPDVVPVGLPSDLLQRRPDIRRAENEFRAATADIAVAEADLFPRFYLTGLANPQSARFTDLFSANSFSWYLGPSISWPIFQGGRITSNIAATEARRDEALARYRQAVLKAVQDVETSLVDYAQSRIERERLAQSTASRSRAMRLAIDRYATGIKDLFSVLDSERQLLEVENSLAMNEAQVMVNLIGLYKALGGGWES
jgi:NodT family efflux transporter outer membrane factor (OMF) lipoprotein